ncbi:50S ribosomal protein L19 [Wolbachia endosymbiont of Ctenocephalides felis wCfeT]|uniref:50S ribosomal protein L19 n=1 Tax=Wolbachia endosymbiont of Ctenocephalides felis wCfeT TaxID=2732593 RepID=UPI001447ED48|nr:50S ribosomal protein L19 [Wolbachia endosymbiont of Ctenocephalides felis wCfeT]
MTSLLEKFNKQQIQQLAKEIPEFRPGDDLKVVFKVVDGGSERMQIFEGVCISKRKRGLHSSFLVRKVSHGESIVSQFFVYSPALVSVQVTRRGKVRRAKLYYLCKLFGKAARIKERTVRKS